MTRKFTDSVAKRGQVALMLGLMGPSGGGKTMSALRLATGIQRVVGGEIFVIDTESNRALHYADEFKFRHVPFSAPFPSDDYLASIQHCASQGAKVVIVDSMSHEHEGQGGVLDMHEQEVIRMGGNDYAKRERVKFAAWIEPKRQRARLLMGITQLGINIICCFRAKEKTKPVTKGQPIHLGWMPIAGPEFVYEMDACALLLPGKEGRPTWEPEYDGEKQMVKMPGFATKMFSEQLDEATGERLARWAQGTHPEFERLIGLLDACSAAQALEALEAPVTKLWSEFSPKEKQALRTSIRSAKVRAEDAANG